MSRTVKTKKWRGVHNEGLNVEEMEHKQAERRRALWFAAIKPPMYTVAVTPMVVGSFAAYAETGLLSIRELILWLMAGVMIIAWLNLTNDVFDYDRGIDDNKEESVVNLCGGGRRVRDAILGLAMWILAVAAVAVWKLMTIHGGRLDGTVGVVITLGVTAGYMYQGPPFRLGYFGLGELITLFGWSLGVCAAYYSQICANQEMKLEITTKYVDVWSRVKFLLGERLWDRDHYLGGAAMLVAVPTAIILFCSHFHQEEDDKRAGKLSPIVRLGTKNALIVLEGVLVSFFTAEYVLHRMGMIPAYVCYGTFLTMPLAMELERFVRKNHLVAPAVKPAKYYAVKFHFVHGMIAAAGFFITGLTRG